MPIRKHSSRKLSGGRRSSGRKLSGRRRRRSGRKLSGGKVRKIRTGPRRGRKVYLSGGTKEEWAVVLIPQYTCKRFFESEEEKDKVRKQITTQLKKADGEHAEKLMQELDDIDNGIVEDDPRIMEWFGPFNTEEKCRDEMNAVLSGDIYM